jgi:iron complex outermembrane receptor protein
MARAFYAFSTAIATGVYVSASAWSASAGAADAGLTAAPAPAAPPRTEEVIVTATRRNEKTSKIPYSITALSGATLARRGVTDLAGLRNSVVGLQATDYGERASNVNNGFVIRGITTNDIGVGESEFPNLAGNTVSNYIDDTPLFVNLKLTDVERVEILRGPQGTLFGADSVGGTVRTIHNKPDPAGFDYQVDGTLSGTDRASQPNSATNIMLNVPITDTFAVRLNAGYDREAGFINADNAVIFNTPGGVNLHSQPVLANPANPLTSPYLTTTDHGINSSEVWFVRGDALWHINDDYTAEINYQHQVNDSDGFNFEYPGADYGSRRRIPINPSTTKTDIVAATMTADFGFGTVTSSSSYYNVDTRDLYDNSGIDVQLPYYYGSYPRITTTNFDANTDRAFAEEARLVSTPGKYFDYVAGIFFQNRRTVADSVETVPGFASWANLPGSGPGGAGTWANYLTQYYGGTRPGSLNPADLTYDFKRSVRFTDLAAFGEATFHLTPHWRLIGGVRVFTEDFHQTTIQHLYNAGTSFGSDSLGTSDGTGSKRSQDQIFKASTAYDLGPHTMAYFVFSQGYRAGGANAYPIGTCVFCNSASLVPFGPDQANNYEIGIKGSYGRSRYTAAIYQIDWSNIQLEVSSTAGTPIIVNGNGARSRGVELEEHYDMTNELTLTGGYAYTNAVLTQAFAITGGYDGAAGALLPGVSRHQVNGALDYLPAQLADHAVDVHVDGSYRSGFANQIQADLPNYRHLSGFALFNASVTGDIAHHVQLQFFAHNLFNAKGVTAESSLSPGSYSAAADAEAHSFDSAEFVTQPLTIGLRLVIRH